MSVKLPFLSLVRIIKKNREAERKRMVKTVIKETLSCTRNENSNSKKDYSTRSEEFKNRPPAVYDNTPSPYGIATEMLWEQLKEGR